MDLYCGSRHIGPGEPCFIIAEVGLAHDGSLQQAHAYIDACAEAGVDAVKFQCHTGDPTTEWRVKPEWGYSSRQHYWERTAFTRAQWEGLATHCANGPKRDVEFLCSVFSVEALRLIDPLVKMHKVPSGRVCDRDLLDAISATHKPVLLSAGMATVAEVSAALCQLANGDRRVGLLQCVTEYPARAENIGLPSVEFYGGLSDHSGTIFPGIAAAALGCQVLEVHVCWSKQQGNLDAAASLTMEQMRQLVEGVRFVEKAMQPVDKDALAAELAETRRVFMA